MVPPALSVKFEQTTHTRFDIWPAVKAGGRVTVPPLLIVTFDAVRHVLQLVKISVALVIDNDARFAVEFVRRTKPLAMATDSPGWG
jgi:hypothetical protein